MNQIKLNRYNHSFAAEISSVILTEVKDENAKLANITGCEITSDLSFCKVYFTVLDSEKKQDVLESLRKAAPFIRGKISERIEIRHTPELKFVYDESVAYGEHIENILKDINEK